MDAHFIRSFFISIQERLSRKVTTVLVLNSGSEAGGIASVTRAILGLNLNANLIDVKISRRPRDLLNLFMQIVSSWILKPQLILSTHSNYLPLMPFFRGRHQLCLLHGIEILELSTQDWSKTRFITNTERMASLVQNFKNTATEHCYYPSGIMMDQMPIEKSTDRFRIVFVGSERKGENYKGLDQLLKAWNYFFSLNGEKKLRMTLVLGGSDKDFLDQIKRNAIPNTEILHNISKDALQTIYKESLALILASKREGQGLVYLEALKFGVPCIGLTGTTADEFVEHKLNGYLLADRSVQSLYDAIDFIALDRERWLTLSRNAQERYGELQVREHFTSLISAYLK